jgi:tRNA/rRNA methyltransferase
LEADLLGRTLRDRVLFVLVRPLQSGNVGAAARALKNMGLRRLAVVAPPAFDIDRARWMAPGAADILDAAHYASSVAEAVAGCRYVVATTARGRHDHWPAHTPATFAPLVFDHEGDTEGHTAVLFGPEDRGLTNEDLRVCHSAMTIPTADFSSLNLAQAVMVVCWELFRCTLGEPAEFAPRLANRFELDAMYAQLKDVLMRICLINPDNPAIVLPSRDSQRGPA